MSSITFDQVWKRFGAVAAVRDLSLTVRDHDFLVLLGPSGCGKSTALRMIAGLEQPSAGVIAIDGRPVNHVPPDRRDVAMVFQNYALYPHMSVHDNIAFGLQARKLPRDEIRTRVAEVAEQLELDDLLRRRPGQLSGGQRQRVALARAMVRRPRAFLMDEPLSNLDAKLRAQTRAELIRLHRRLEATIVYVTHDQVEAMTMGTRVAVMNAGVLQQVGPPIEVYDRPANLFVAQFIGSPPMNLLPSTVVVDGDGMSLRADGLVARLSPAQAAAVTTAGAAEVVVGFRPQHVALGPAPDAAGLEATAEVDVVEALGSETVVTLATAGPPLIARVDGAARLTPCERVRVTVPLAAFHLFDRATGARIELPAGAAAPAPVPVLAR